MTTNYHLVIAEGHEFVQQLLAAHFQNEGFRVTQACTGRELLAAVGKSAIDLILLDLGLPDEDGLVLMRQIRSRSSIPIVVLTARQQQEDLISALELGADDYLNKPCDPKELVLRSKNFLHRSNTNSSATTTRQKPERFSFEGWMLDLSSRCLCDSEGNEIDLSRSEFNLLSALVMASNRVLSRAFLLDAISHSDSSPSERMIDVIVARLRQKLERDPKNPQIIKTMIGLGYKFSGKIDA